MLVCPRPRLKLRSIAPSADDLATAAIDVHPDHRSIAQELERVNVRGRIIVETEILRAGHAGNHAPADLAHGQVLAVHAAFPGGALAAILAPVHAVAQRMRGRDADK